CVQAGSSSKSPPAETSTTKTPPKAPTTKLAIIAPYHPTKKMPNWWLVVGEPSTRQPLVSKRVTNNTLTVKLEFTLPIGKHPLKLYVICDSSAGANHDIGLEEDKVAQGEDEDV
ncbi:hypothetical protein F5876DRAFT_71104, partial [Lentinula aff. lateritia]